MLFADRFALCGELEDEDEEKSGSETDSQDSCQRMEEMAFLGPDIGDDSLSHSRSTDSNPSLVKA